MFMLHSYKNEITDVKATLIGARSAFVLEVRNQNIPNGCYFLSYLIIMAEWMKLTDEGNNKNTPIAKYSEYIFKEEPRIGCGVREKGRIEDNYKVLDLNNQEDGFLFNKIGKNQ